MRLGRAVENQSSDRFLLFGSQINASNFCMEPQPVINKTSGRGIPGSEMCPKWAGGDGKSVTYFDAADEAAVVGAPNLAGSLFGSKPPPPLPPPLPAPLVPTALALRVLAAPRTLAAASAGLALLRACVTAMSRAV